MEEAASSCQRETLITEGKRVKEHWHLGSVQCRFSSFRRFSGVCLCICVQQNMKKVQLRSWNSCHLVTRLMAALAACHLIKEENRLSLQMLLKSHLCSS